MKRTIKFLSIALIIAASLTSCSNDVSLQRYFVDHQEAKDFISQDLPLSMLSIDKSDFTEAQEEAYNSVSKLNFLGYKSEDTESETFKAEVVKVKAILSDTKYSDLMEFSHKGNKITVKFLGEETEADEFIVFGNAENMGFGIVRILGNDMSPDKMMTLMEALKHVNFEEKQLEDIINFFK